MHLLGLDIGTTHCKAALFSPAGELVSASSADTPTDRTAEGGAVHDVNELWAAVAQVTREAAGGAEVSAIGVASMAEAGVLLDRATGVPRTPVVAWFDTRATAAAEALEHREGAASLFRRSGLHASYKYGLCKLLWLREQQPGVVDGATWLSVADYIVYRLTGHAGTDPTLAARTFAYSILDRQWDKAFLHRVGIDPAVFPAVRASGAVAGRTTGAAGEAGLAGGVPVAVCGHDHLCSCFAAGVIEPGTLLDSVGTAESLVAVAPGAALGDAEFESGLALVPHVLPDLYCWLGGVSSAGGSIEWVRRLLDASPRSYAGFLDDLAMAGEGPTGILFYPYLLGSGAPAPDRRARATFVGLAVGDDRARISRAVLEGVAYEAESVRRAIESLTGRVSRTVVVGGGTRNRPWMQIKADVSGHEHVIPLLSEATAFGAAMVAGLGAGVISGLEAVREVTRRAQEHGETIVPDEARHWAYRAIYERAYRPYAALVREQSGALRAAREGGN